jgi:hypothetical protein
MNSTLFLQTSSLGYSEINKESFLFFNGVTNTDTSSGNTVTGNTVTGNTVTLNDTTFGNYVGLINTLSTDSKYEFNDKYDMNEPNLEIEKQVEEDIKSLNSANNNLAIASSIAVATMIVFAFILQR